MLERSFAKWQEGLRTQPKDCPVWPVYWQGKPLSGAFLVSGYAQGTFAVITTPAHQWLCLTAELSQARRLGRRMVQTATPFGVLIEQRGKKVTPVDLPKEEG
jgi:hypothetical protein